MSQGVGERLAGYDRVVVAADIGDHGDELRPALANALNAVAGLIDLQTDPDRQVTLHADVNANAATVSVGIGKKVAAPVSNNPYEWETQRS